MCPNYRKYLICLDGPGGGPCRQCWVEDQANLLVFGIPIPDYAALASARGVDCTSDH